MVRGKSSKNNFLETILGAGKSIAEDLPNIGVHSVADLKGKDFCGGVVEYA